MPSKHFQLLAGVKLIPVDSKDTEQEMPLTVKAACWPSSSTSSSTCSSVSVEDDLVSDYLPLSNLGIF